MSDGIQQKPLAPFTTINYTTKDGEHCTATKNNGVVTVVSDKNGVKQLPLDAFMQEFITSLPQTNLERQPKQDTVAFSGAETPDEPSSEAEQGVSKGLIATIATVGTVLIGTGIYFLSKGKNKQVVKEAAQEVVEKSKAVADEVVDKTKEVTTNVSEKLTEKGKAVAEEIANKTEEVASKVSEKAAEVKEKVAPVVETVQQKVKTVATDIEATIEETLGQANTAKAGENPVEVLIPDKVEMPKKPAGKTGKSKNKTPKNIVIQEEVKPQPAKPSTKPNKNANVDAAKPKEQKPQAEVLKNDNSTQLAEIQKQEQEFIEQQQKAQQAAAAKQAQQIEDDNNMIATALLADQAFGPGSKQVIEGVKDIADDAGKVADDLIDGIKINTSKLSDGVADGVKLTDNPFEDSTLGKIIGEDMDGLNSAYKSDLGELYKQVDESLEGSYDALKSDFYNVTDSFDDFTAHVDDFINPIDDFSDFGGGIM